MKHIFITLLSLFFLIIMLLFPSETLHGTTNGLLLWFQIVLPSLLPFFIITNLLIRTNAFHFITKLCGPLFQYFFRISPNGSFAVLTGFFCGYPIGAKVTSDLVKQNKISNTEGNYLLSFCNNSSPAFISNYIILQQFKDPSLLIPSILLLFLSPILCSFIFRRYYKTQKSQKKTLSNSHLYFHFQLLDDSIMNAFETITKIGGYIIIFSILFSLGIHTPIHAFLPILEITNGISYLTKTSQNFIYTYVSIMALTSFGGLCSIAQTYSVIQGSKLSILSYTIEKLITALVTSLLAIIYITIILR